MTNDPEDPKKPQEISPGETPDPLPDIPEHPIEEPAPDVVQEEAPDITPVPGGSSDEDGAIRSHAESRRNFIELKGTTLPERHLSPRSDWE